MDKFVDILPSLAKTSANASWWNNYTDTDDVLYTNGTVYEAISVSPVDNVYFESNTYYLPKKKF